MALSLLESGVRVVSFDAFSSLSSIPRCPERLDLCVDLASIDRSQSLVVFVSHNWLRETHPDNASGDKFKLCVEGITMLMKHMASGAKRCYIWMDFCCLNQDNDPAGEMMSIDLGEIMKGADCIFTPICSSSINGSNDNDSNDNDRNNSNVCKDAHLDSDVCKVVLHNIDNDNGGAAIWNDRPLAYSCRTWCRLEMLTGAYISIPSLEEEERDRIQRFFPNNCPLSQGMRSQLLIGSRPHIIFGSVQSDDTSTSSQPPTQLPPPPTTTTATTTTTTPPLLLLPPLCSAALDRLSNSCELGGNVSKPSDAAIIQVLFSRLRPLLISSPLKDIISSSKASKDGVVRGYDGPVEGKLRSGRGVQKYASGCSYEGDFACGKFSGQGTFQYADGNVYQGQFLDGSPCGRGVYRYANGDVYEGEFKDGKFSGKGVFRFKISGALHEGDWVDGRLVVSKSKKMIEFEIAAISNSVGLLLSPPIFPSSSPLDYQERNDSDSDTAIATVDDKHIDALLNLASKYRDIGNYEQAKLIYKDVLQRQIAKLGHEHPDTLASMTQLAITHQASGEVVRAIELFGKTVLGFSSVRGRSSAEALKAISRMALAYRKAGAESRALRLDGEITKRKKGASTGLGKSKRRKEISQRGLFLSGFLQSLPYIALVLILLAMHFINLN